MYEGLYERLPDAGAYLRRIGLKEGEIKPDRKGLDTLVHAQLTHVPFENLDPWGGGICPSLEIKSLYEKIVLRRRGGYCFELNSLFNALLKSLGYDSHLVAVHIMAGRNEMGPACHCAAVCSIDGERYFCDVGYGGPVPDGGLSFSGEERFGFRIEKCGEWIKLINLREGREEMRFRDTYIEPTELHPANYYMACSPNSPFRNNLHMNLRLENGSVSIIDSEFRLRRGAERRDEPLELSGLPEIIEEFFGIPACEAELRKAN